MVSVPLQVCCIGRRIAAQAAVQDVGIPPGGHSTPAVQQASVTRLEKVVNSPKSAQLVGGRVIGTRRRRRGGHGYKSSPYNWSLQRPILRCPCGGCAHQRDRRHRGKPQYYLRKIHRACTCRIWHHKSFHSTLRLPTRDLLTPLLRGSTPRSLLYHHVVGCNLHTGRRVRSG